MTCKNVQTKIKLSKILKESYIRLLQGNVDYKFNITGYKVGTH